jgi:hypothetical protein
LKAIHQALIEFCRDVGVDSGCIIQWMTPAEGRDSIDECLALEGIEPGKELLYSLKIIFGILEVDKDIKLLCTFLLGFIISAYH